MDQDLEFTKTSYGVGSRLKHPPTREMQEFFKHIYLDHVDKAAFQSSIEINMAHVLMLKEESIIDAETAASLLEELESLRTRGIENFSFDAAIGDSLPNLENHIIHKLGDRTGGMLHTGRSRGDYYATLSRMKFRKHIMALMEEILGFRRVLVSLVEQHPESIMPGYTHLQHAQPITLGYYFCAYVHELERDFSRTMDAYDRMNISPLGLGIISGTSYPLNRRRTAQLLGFQDILRNGRDLTDRDYAVEATTAAVSVMLHLHKLATDLYEWATSEFSTARVDDGDAMTSSMMPQKANPVLLEEMRVNTALVIGDMTSLLTMIKGSPANNIEQTSGDIPALAAIDRTSSSLQTFRAFLPRIDFDLERMEYLVARHWSQATDLADTLVNNSELSFREAHRVVGALVASSYEKRMTPQQVSHVDLQAAAESVLPTSTGLAHIELDEALNPRHALNQRQVEGGPAPSLVRAAARAAAARLEADSVTLSDRQSQLSASRDTLLSQAATLVQRRG